MQILATVGLLTIAMSSLAQDDSIKNSNEGVEEQINQNIELVAEQQQAEEGDLSNLTGTWRYYRTHPINLNRASREDLEELQLLNEIQINNLLKHLEKNGYLISIYELQGVEDFDLATIRKILPFVYVSDNFNAAFFNFREMMKDGHHEVVSRMQRTLEHQAGYFTPDSITRAKKPNSYYLGDANRLFLRYRFTYNQNVSVAISGEKDAGEQFFRGTQSQGFDFYSGHIAIRNIRFIKCLTIGDYQATFGQGLTLWNGFAFGKSASPMTVKRAGMGIRPYYSFDENRFFRGAAGTFRIKKLEATALISYKKIDANATMADTNSNGEIDVVGVSSLETGGLHNTNALIADKGQITQLVAGGNLAYNQRNLHIGLTGQSMSLSAGLSKTPQLYNRYDFSGRHNINVGADYSYVFKNVNLYGEAAVSENGGRAFVQGAVFALDPRLTFTAHYRNFSRDYQNLFGNAMSENTLPQNEQGLYLAAEARLPGNFTLSVFLDQYKFSWLKFGVSAPSVGHDIFAQLNYTPSKKTDLYLRYRHRIKFEDSDIDNVYQYPVPYSQENYRFNLSTQIAPAIKIKSRLEYTHVNEASDHNNNGVALVQDIIFRKITSPLSITLRYAVFDTKNYNSRIYAFENDVLYSYSVPSLYYQGQRAFILINWNISRKLELWLRIARTVYDNQTVISPGTLNEIDDDHKTDIKVQLRLRI